MTCVLWTYNVASVGRYTILHSFWAGMKTWNTGLAFCSHKRTMISAWFLWQSKATCCVHHLLSGESQQIGVHDIQDSFLCQHESLYSKYIVWTSSLKDHLSDQASKLYSYFKTYISSVNSLIFSLFAWATGVSLLWLTYNIKSKSDMTWQLRSEELSITGKEVGARN